MPKGIPISGVNKGWFKKGHIPENPIQKGEHRSLETQFKKGLIPWCKGEKGIHLSPETEFKKGSIPWNKDTLYGKNESLLKKIKQSTEYANWRKVVYENNNYECKTCGSKKNIRAHHLVPIKTIYIEFLERYIEAGSKELYKLSKDYDDFWNIKNGITLCNKCHMKVHGWICLGNTPRQPKPASKKKK